jgi:hypothetical protein
LDTGTQIAAAAIISFFLNFLKRSKYFPGITAETGKSRAGHDDSVKSPVSLRLVCG